MQNGKGMKEREGDNLYPQQARYRHRLMMGTVGQVPVLRQLARTHGSLFSSASVPGPE